MEFPSYVPLPVRTFLSEMVDGDGNNWQGYARLLENNSQETASVEAQLSEARCQCPNCEKEFEDPNDRDCISHLKEIIASIAVRSKIWQQELDLYHRLGHDIRMRETFEIFGQEFTTEYVPVIFLAAATSARDNFSAYRAIGRRVEKLKAAVAEAAILLARQVRELRETGVWLPPELMPIPNEDNFANLTGATCEITQLKTLRIFRLVRENAQKLDRTVPDIVPTLYKLAKVTADLKPDFMRKNIHAALRTRQDSSKTSYIRSFGALLIEKKIELTPRVKRAIAITANVVLNDTNYDVSDDDVRKALQILEGTACEGRS